MRHVLDACGKLEDVDTAFIKNNHALEYIKLMTAFTKRETGPNNGGFD